MCYMGIEDAKNALKNTMDFIANPSSSFAGQKKSLVIQSTFSWHIL